LNRHYRADTVSVRTTIVLALVLAGIACASSTPRVAMRAPNPNGCYVMLFQERGFQSDADVLNGPGRWATLDELPETNHMRWANRIRSLRAGGKAAVTVYADPHFRGYVQQLHTGAESPDVGPELADNIESLEIACDSSR
jgi:hypothetical protein